MSERTAAESLREKAADYHQRATDLEAGQPEENHDGESQGELQCPKPLRE